MAEHGRAVRKKVMSVSELSKSSSRSPRAITLLLHPVVSVFVHVLGQRLQGSMQAINPRPQCRPAPIASGPGAFRSSLNRNVKWTAVNSRRYFGLK